MLISEQVIISSHSSKSTLFYSGTNVHFKCEHLQKTGSFKSRGALNAALGVKEEKGDDCQGVVRIEIVIVSNKLESIIYS